MFPLDLLADLPEPRDDEPASLRADIADELADHLQCAFRREVLKDGDTAAAQRRALDRFGDPQQLARRLWWQAMRSQLMKQRIVFALQWMVALTAMLISGAVFWQQSQLLAELRQARQEDAAQRQALTAKLDQLQLQPPAAAPDLPAVGPSDYSSRPEPRLAYGAPILGPPVAMPLDQVPVEDVPRTAGPDLAPEGAPVSSTATDSPVLTLKFVQETEDGPPMMPAHATLTDRGNVAHPGVREPPTGSKILFQGIEPDLYQLSVTLADGQQSERTLLIRDKKPRELTILCPAPRKKTPVAITMKPLPEKLRKRNFQVRMSVGTGEIIIGQSRWQSADTPWQTITFDGESGLPVGVAAVYSRSPSNLDLRDLPADERLVFLPVGPVSYGFEAFEQMPAPSSVTLYQWPKPATRENENRHIIAANESRWEVELPKEFLEEMLRDVAEANTSPAALRAN